MKENKSKLGLLALLVMMMLMCPLTANAASKKSDVNKAVNNFLSYTKVLNIKKMESCFGKSEVARFDMPSIFYDAIRPYNEKMSWSIENTKVKGNMAKVKVKVKFQTLVPAYMATLYGIASLRAKKNDMASYMRLKREVFKCFQRCLKDYPSKEITATVRVPLKKINGKWKIAEMTDRLYCIAYGDLFMLCGNKDEYKKIENDLFKEFYREMQNKGK